MLAVSWSTLWPFSAAERSSYVKRYNSMVCPRPAARRAVVSDSDRALKHRTAFNALCSPAALSRSTPLTPRPTWSSACPADSKALAHPPCYLIKASHVFQVLYVDKCDVCARGIEEVLSAREVQPNQTLRLELERRHPLQAPQAPSHGARLSPSYRRIAKWPPERPELYAGGLRAAHGAWPWCRREVPSPQRRRGHPSRMTAKTGAQPRFSQVRRTLRGLKKAKIANDGLAKAPASAWPDAPRAAYEPAPSAGRGISSRLHMRPRAACCDNTSGPGDRGPRTRAGARRTAGERSGAAPTGAEMMTRGMRRRMRRRAGCSSRSERRAWRSAAATATTTTATATATGVGSRERVHSTFNGKISKLHP
eukprot:scaffold1702_cov391-Prasinococcus_capsulatus_cf.AAC.3